MPRTIPHCSLLWALAASRSSRLAHRARGTPFAAQPAMRERFIIGLLSLGVVTSCGVDQPSGDDVAEISQVTYGVDYSYSRPAPATLAAQGYTFAARYLSDDASKNLTIGEASGLIGAGLSVVSNWEAGGQNALGGFTQGANDAQTAEAQALAAGMPATRPIYFSIDFDAQPSQQAAIDAYFDGVASVLGRDRTGAYGGYGVIKRLFDAG